MKLTVSLNGCTYRADTEQAQNIAIPLNFDGAQPNHFGAPVARAETLEAEGFVGDTRRGGSCNVSQLTLVPHCNGTHTESVSHIVDELVPVGELLSPLLLPCVVVSVKAETLGSCNESYTPNPETGDLVVSGRRLAEALSQQPMANYCQAIVIRTLPNDEDKCRRAYTEGQPPVFFSSEAMELLLTFDHLLVDFPSVDKMYDDGALDNHHRFWQIAAGSHSIDSGARSECTITEMVYVADSMADGLYLLNLQIPAFRTDAAPSRPVLMPLEEIE
ncbi:Putative cyclase [Microbulbifer donghaiensis]|uniref:Putative cyclase n=1 Tax=Microbulbifer donghaiensis TaxID=494016 RepID=A0A1M5CEQ6_9GAMM|nr:cyclase family protein [Microbulbifer donghaiensis]SHF53191.1 Putative cyclase [Microbulbifer donghaiensis]